MRVLIQRVKSASIANSDNPSHKLSQIGKGMVILAGFEEADGLVNIEQLTMKIKNLRIFADTAGKMNVSGPDSQAEYLIVSQFTLYAQCKYGNRPSFDEAAPKARAKEYYEHFVSTSQRVLGKERVFAGIFGSDLLVDIQNDGPVTIWMDSKNVL